MSVRSSFGFALLLAAVACSDEESTAGSQASSEAALSTGATGAGGDAGGGGSGSGTSGGGPGGGCPAGVNSTVVEASLQNPCDKPQLLDGKKPPGACCMLAEECKPQCCSCPGGMTVYFGVFCARGICATTEPTCTATASDACM